MTFEDLREALPGYAKDLKLNLSSLSRDETLSAARKWGCFLASAAAVGEPKTLSAMLAEASANMSEAEVEAAKGAAAIMGMNNVYYRFVHLASAKDYQTLPAKLRMNIIGNPGVPKEDFELWSLAVSAVNGCGMCIDAHEAELRKHGLSTAEVQAAVRIASVVAAVAAVMRSEDAMAAA